jgi:DNA-binding NarL/FixJ family response regulator
MDVLMPGMDGIEALQKIRSSADPKIATIPVVMHSIARDRRIVERAMSAGAQDFIFKGTATEELWRRLEKYLAA